MDTVIFVLAFLVAPVALLLAGIASVYRDHFRGKEEFAKSQTFEAKVEQALARKQEAIAIKKEVARRMAAQDQ